MRSWSSWWLVVACLGIASSGFARLTPKNIFEAVAGMESLGSCELRAEMQADGLALSLSEGSKALSISVRLNPAHGSMRVETGQQLIAEFPELATARQEADEPTSNYVFGTYSTYLRLYWRFQNGKRRAIGAVLHEYKRTITGKTLLDYIACGDTGTYLDSPRFK